MISPGTVRGSMTYNRIEPLRGHARGDVYSGVSIDLGDTLS